jgi:hypothetical protein
VKWYKSLEYTGYGCEFCGTAGNHASWCINANTAVAYAFTIVNKTEYIQPGDHLRLLGLGVRWV